MSPRPHTPGPETRAEDSRRQLRSVAAREIRRLILTGELAGGQRLRVEPLAAQLNVSATPVREALISLTGHGLVRFDHGRGFTVLPLRREDMIDLYAMQAHISGELAIRATPRLSDVAIDELEEMQAALERAIDGGDLVAAQRIDFAQHRLINRAAAAPKLTWLLTSTMRFVPFDAYAEIPGWPAAGRNDHAAIFAGFRTGNPLTARDAMRAHIRHSGDLLVQLLTLRGVLTNEV